MDQVLSLQHLEYLETGFEVSKILAHAGYRMDQAAFTITWGQLAEAVAHTLSDDGLSTDRLEERFIVDLVESLQKALSQDEILDWQETVGEFITAQPEIVNLLDPENAYPSSIDNEDEEGPLTEQYENATRCQDDEAYWPDGGVSAGFYEDI
jgi:hypothetical protein